MANLVGTTYLCLGDIVKEEERRAFKQRTRLAGKVAVDLTVEVMTTGEIITIGMMKGQTIGEMKSKIEHKVGIAKDQLRLQFPGQHYR